MVLGRTSLPVRAPARRPGPGRAGRSCKAFKLPVVPGPGAADSAMIHARCQTWRARTYVHGAGPVARARTVTPAAAARRGRLGITRTHTSVPGRRARTDAHGAGQAGSG